jgi:hypothetical protein
MVHVSSGHEHDGKAEDKTRTGAARPDPWRGRDRDRVAGILRLLDRRHHPCRRGRAGDILHLLQEQGRTVPRTGHGNGAGNPRDRGASHRAGARPAVGGACGARGLPAFRRGAAHALPHRGGGALRRPRRLSQLFRGFRGRLCDRLTRGGGDGRDLPRRRRGAGLGADGHGEGVGRPLRALGRRAGHQPCGGRGARDDLQGLAP